MIEVVRDFAGMESLRADWERLSSETSASPLLGYSWISAAASVFCEDGDIRLVCCRGRDGELLAIAPLALSPSGKGQRLGAIGCERLGEPGGFVFRDKKALAELCRAVVRLGTPLHLVRFGEEEREGLAAAARFRALLAVNPEAGLPYLPLAESWQRFEAALPGRRQQRLRRARRLAGELGEASFSFSRPDPDQWTREFRDLMDIEAASWKGAAGTALGQNVPLAVFYRLMGALSADRGELVVGRMAIAGEIAAMQLALLQGGALWVLKASYHERYARCSPGILLMHEMLRFAHESGCRRFEFLGLHEPWIEIWTDLIHPQMTLRLFQYNVRGMRGLAQAMSAKLARLGGKRLPASGAGEAAYAN